MTKSNGAGPLSGLKLLEFAAIGPAPFCAMLLCDLGADGIRIDRKGARPRPKSDVIFRGRRSVALDLKNAASIEACKKLFAECDVVLEGFRPGVMERLGVGPDVALSCNPRLVYGRMTGWGQRGRLAQAAGHDVAYLALTGALHAIGIKERPTIPINLVADYGGGALFLALGVLAAVLHARKTGEGQVVDCAMTDGTIALLTQIYGHVSAGTWKDERQANIIDGGAHFYNVYECSDGKFIAVGAIEPQFYALLLEKTGISDPAFQAQHDRSRWPELKEKLATVFRTKTRAEWCAVMEGSDACFAPVLSLKEAPSHAYHRERGSFFVEDGIVQPAPAPRFSKTPGRVQSGTAVPGADNDSALGDWGLSPTEIAKLREAGAM